MVLVNFGKKAPKPYLMPRNVRSMTAPKTCFQRLRKGYAPKNIIWAPKNVEKAHIWASKMEKITFLKKPEFRDLTEHWGWSRQLP